MHVPCLLRENVDKEKDALSYQKSVTNKAERGGD